MRPVYRIRVKNIAYNRYPYNIFWSYHDQDQDRHFQASHS